MSDHRAIKLKGTTLHTPTSYSTVDDATYVRVVSYSTGGQNFRVASDSAGSNVVARYAVAPKEALYIKKDPAHFVGGGSGLLRCNAVSIEG
tara:strand:+ start:482 stop:754 length:273 start_codon:yes stop_codon:yes gene_type:complete